MLQVEGKACWRLYKPIEELATEDSVDLDESEIGDVIQEYELQVIKVAPNSFIEL